MKALSVQQPWAWLIVHGYKPVENRSWRSSHRGPTLIHAGKKFDMDGYLFVRGAFPEIDMPGHGEFPRGGIVGSVTVVDCVDEHDSVWYAGDVAFVLEDPKPLPFRPLRGLLYFFDVPETP